MVYGILVVLVSHSNISKLSFYMPNANIACSFHDITGIPRKKICFNNILTLLLLSPGDGLLTQPAGKGYISGSLPSNIMVTGIFTC